MAMLSQLVPSLLNGLEEESCLCTQYTCGISKLVVLLENDRLLHTLVLQIGNMQLPVVFRVGLSEC